MTRGKYIRTKEIKLKMSLSHKGKSPSNKGGSWSKKTRKKHEKIRSSKEWSKKMRECKLGRKNPMFGRKEELSPFWKGEEVSYSGLHKWVRNKLGSPKKCSICGKTKKHIDWSNKSKKYKRNLDDWIALCRSCHRKRDNKYANS